MKRGISIIGIGLAVGIGVGVYLYRTASPVAPAAAVGQDGGVRCDACHEELVSYWRRGGHRGVDCDVCHGPPREHLIAQIDPRPKLLVKGPLHCLGCHFCQEDDSKDTERPDQLERHLKAIEMKHVVTIDRARVAGRCSYCHNPHSLE